MKHEEKLSRKDFQQNLIKYKINIDFIDPSLRNKHFREIFQYLILGYMLVYQNYILLSNLLVELCRIKNH